jgi:uncharacterized protein
MLAGAAIAGWGLPRSWFESPMMAQQSIPAGYDLSLALPHRSVTETSPVADTRRWLERAVIGLNLCPFAKAVHLKRQIRWVECAASDVQGLLAELVTEMQTLAAADPADIDTTLIVHATALRDFEDHNDFLDLADAALDALGLVGVLQVASFHPDYRFADCEPDDPANLSNRSPHPTLHLLREDSISRAVDAMPDADDIFERNIDTLRRLGHGGWQRLLADEGG